MKLTHIFVRIFVPDDAFVATMKFFAVEHNVLERMRIRQQKVQCHEK